MKTYLLAATLLTAASLGFAQVVAPGAGSSSSESMAQEKLVGEIEAWRATQLPQLTPPDPITVALEPRLDEIKSAALKAKDDAALAEPSRDFEDWKTSLLKQKYAAEVAQGRGAGGFAQYSQDQTQVASFSSALSASVRSQNMQAAQDATMKKFMILSQAAQLGAVQNPSQYFDGVHSLGGVSGADPAVVTAPPALDPKDPARYAKVRQILISQGARPHVIDLAIQEAIRQNADPLLVLAVIKQESSFHTHATSGVGARGLMQIMPDTGRGLGVRNSSQLYDAQTNLRAGIRFLKSLWGQFVGGDMTAIAGMNPFYSHGAKAAVAAYNAGPGAVHRYGGVPPYRETQGYVKLVLGYYNSFRQSMDA